MARFAEIDTDTKVEECVAACRKHGLSLTQQRVAIYKILAQAVDHPSAERIYEVVRADFPAMSLATVYKTLETFESIGLINKVTDLHEAARYDANSDRHHHLVCTRCRKVFDYYDDDLATLPLPTDALDGAFHITGYTVQLNGLCAACRSGE